MKRRRSRRRKKTGYIVFILAAVAVLYGAYRKGGIRRNVRHA